MVDMSKYESHTIDVNIYVSSQRFKLESIIESSLDQITITPGPFCFLKSHPIPRQMRNGLSENTSDRTISTMSSNNTEEENGSSFSQKRSVPSFFSREDPQRTFREKSGKFNALPNIIEDVDPLLTHLPQLPEDTSIALMILILQCADISYVCRPLSTANELGELFLQELKLQKDLEVGDFFFFF